jgi:hypothetical protein
MRFTVGSLLWLMLFLAVSATFHHLDWPGTILMALVVYSGIAAIAWWQRRKLS